MQALKSATSVILLLILTMAFYQNCANYQEGGLFDGSEIDPTEVGMGVVRVGSPNHNLEVTPFDDYLSMGGECFTGKSSHRLEARLFSVLNERIKLDVTSPGCTSGGLAESCYYLDRHRLTNADIRCENGRYYFVLPITCDGLRFRNVGYKVQIQLIKKDSSGNDVIDPTLKQVKQVIVQWTQGNIDYCTGLGFPL